MTNKLKELEKILEKECPKYESDCKKCPYFNKCEEYGRLYRMEVLKNEN